MRKTVALFGLLLVSNFSVAGTSITGKVTKVWAQVVGGYDTFAVQLDVPHINPDGCQHQGWYRLSASNNSGYKTAVSVLLSAYATGKSVDLYLDGCDSYPRYTNVSM